MGISLMIDEIEPSSGAPKQTWPDGRPEITRTGKTGKTGRNRRSRTFNPAAKPKFNIGRQ